MYDYICNNRIDWKERKTPPVMNGSELTFNFPQL